MRADGACLSLTRCSLDRHSLTESAFFESFEDRFRDAFDLLEPVGAVLSRRGDAVGCPGLAFSRKRGNCSCGEATEEKVTAVESLFFCIFRHMS